MDKASYGNPGEVIIVNLQNHLLEYKKDGYTVFHDYLTVEEVQEWRQAMDPQFDTLFSVNSNKPRVKIVPLLDHEKLAPLAKKHVTNSIMLDFAELVMGPFVQLDSFEVSGFSIRELGLTDSVDLWHRDAFNVTQTWIDHPLFSSKKRRPYTPPLACNCLTYLQDMTEESGPLRVIPGSHLDYTRIPESAERRVHVRERLLDVKAGAMVFTHNELLHSGTWNVSEHYRYFLSVYLCRFGLPHRDPFDLAAIEQLQKDARCRNDRRVLRLFGEDKEFMEREEISWQTMAEEDRRNVRSTNSNSETSFK